MQNKLTLVFTSYPNQICVDNTTQTEILRLDLVLLCLFSHA